MEGGVILREAVALERWGDDAFGARVEGADGRGVWGTFGTCVGK